MTASALHLAAAGVWAGGLVVLLVCLAPATRRSAPSGGPVLGVRAWRAFSPVAATAAVVLVATGLYASGRHLPDLGSLTSTVYGAGVVAKVGLAAVALVLAAANTLLIHPGLLARLPGVPDQPRGWTDVPPRRLTPVVALEAIALIVAVGVAALLTSVPTARELGAGAVHTGPQTAYVDGLFVSFEEVPAIADSSRVVVRTRSTVEPDRGRIVGVEVLLAGPSGTNNVILERVEQGRYESSTAVPVPGRWTALVTVQRAGVPAATAEVGWTVVRPVDGAVSRLEAVATTMAALLLVGLAAVLLFLRRGRGGRRRAPRAVRASQGKVVTARGRGPGPGRGRELTADNLDVDAYDLL